MLEICLVSVFAFEVEFSSRICVSYCSELPLSSGILQSLKVLYFGVRESSLCSETCTEQTLSNLVEL